MIQFVYGQDTTISEFVAKLIPGAERGFGNGSKTIGIIDGQGRFLAGVVYHHWHPEHGTIAMSAAALTPRWLSRRTVQRIFDYPFAEFPGCQMVMMQVRADDLRLQRQLAVGGFALTPIARIYGRNEDGVIATLTDEDWIACPFNRGRDKMKEAA